MNTRAHKLPPSLYFFRNWSSPFPSVFLPWEIWSCHFKWQVFALLCNRAKKPTKLYEETLITQRNWKQFLSGPGLLVTTSERSNTNVGTNKEQGNKTVFPKAEAVKEFQQGQRSVRALFSFIGLPVDNKATAYSENLLVSRRCFS